MEHDTEKELEGSERMWRAEAETMGSRLQVPSFFQNSHYSCINTCFR